MIDGSGGRNDSWNCIRWWDLNSACQAKRVFIQSFWMGLYWTYRWVCECLYSNISSYCWLLDYLALASLQWTLNLTSNNQNLGNNPCKSFTFWQEFIQVYSISTWFSIMHPQHIFAVNTIRDFYEAYVLYTFMNLLVQFLGGENSLIVHFEFKRRIKQPWPLHNRTPISTDK